MRKKFFRQKFHLYFSQVFLNHHIFSIYIILKDYQLFFFKVFNKFQVVVDDKKEVLIQ